jgi:hypothetical protein
MFGCTNSQPVVTTLNNPFWLSLDNLVIQYSSLSSVEFLGTCGPGIQAVEYSLDDGVAWHAISQNSVSSMDACKVDKTFKVTLDLSTNPAHAWSGSPFGNFHVLFRAQIPDGFTSTSNVVLRKLVPTKLVLSNSSLKQAVSGYKVTTRLVSTSSSDDNGFYKTKLRVSQ